MTTPTPPPLRVVIADDQPLVRSGLEMILDGYDGIDLLGSAADGREALALVRSERPDVILMDIRMPVMDGIAATRAIAADPAITTRVLVLTTFDLDEYIHQALKAGASGFMLKNKPADDIVAAIRTVARGEELLGPVITRRLIEHYLQTPRPVAGGSLDQLTQRELAVLRELGRGRSNQEIAAELSIGEATVKTHVSRVLTKLAIRDRAQAVVVAYELGVVRPGER
jgi:DNA-binding NarL/FixJ family response regulator